MASKEQSESRSAYWGQQVTSWKASGQSQKLFCEDQGLSYHRFGYWQRKLLGADKTSERCSRSGFVPVTLNQQPKLTGLSLILPSGLVVQGIASDNIPVVYQLLARLS